MASNGLPQLGPHFPVTQHQPAPTSLLIPTPLSNSLPFSSLPPGYIPSEIGDFSYLQSIYLAVNSLHGSIPLELGNSPSLSESDLGSNSFNGSLPPSIWNLCDQLVSVHFHGNRLSGSLPNPAGANRTCDSLKILDFGENKLEGGFPLFITKFSGLQELGLSANRFTGSVPEALAEMKSLQANAFHFLEKNVYNLPFSRDIPCCKQIPVLEEKNKF